jgi:hypothetical protein
MGIMIARFDLEKSLKDYKVTLERIAMAAKWNNDTISAWQQKGQDACEDLLKEAEKALKKAKEREATETMLKIMEARRDKLVVLADAVQDEAEERSRDELIDLGKEFLHNIENMLSMAKMLRGIKDPDITVRAQKALDGTTEATSKCCICLAGF